MNKVLIFFIIVLSLCNSTEAQYYDQIIDREQTDQSVWEIFPVRADLPDATAVVNERMKAGISIVSITSTTSPIGVDVQMYLLKDAGPPPVWIPWPPFGQFNQHGDNEWQYEVIGDTFDGTLTADQTVFYTDELYNLSHGFQLLICYGNDFETDLGLGTHYILPGTRTVEIRRPLPDLGFPLTDPFPPFNDRRVYLKAGYSILK